MTTRRGWLAGVSALGLAGLSSCAATSHSATALDSQPAPGAATEPAAPALAPCPPAHPKTHRKRKPHAKEPQGPPSASPAVTDTTVDAQEGQVGGSLTSLLGKNVQDPGGEALGRVVDVLADANGRVRVAIIDFGGFLGVGTRRIAVDWPLLRFKPSDRSLTLSVTREKLQSAPEYKDSTSPRVLMPPPAASKDAADTGQTEK